MPNLSLTLACWDYDRTRPLFDGRVKAEGIDLDFKVMRPREIFPRMLERRECPFVGLPIALSKIFRHSCIYVRPGAGITKPADLKGKRIGVSQYAASAIVYMRGMMQHDYGLMPGDSHWLQGGLNVPTVPPKVPLKLPPEVRLDYLEDNETLEA